MHVRPRTRSHLLQHLGLAALALAWSGCGGEDRNVVGTTAQPAPGAFPQTLFVAHEGSLVSYDVETGAERPGAVQQVSNPTDLQALSDGTLLVNLTDQNHILIVDPRTMLERSRIHCSSSAVRPGRLSSRVNTSRASGLAAGSDES